MKRTLVATAAVLALTACGSRAPTPAATGPTSDPSVSASDTLPPTEAPATSEPSTSTAPSSTTTAAPSTTPGATSSATASPSVSPVPTATPLHLGVIAADRPTFEKLLAARKTLGSRSVTATWFTTCAQLTGVDLALVQGEACPGKAFPVLAAGPGLGDLSSSITEITSLTVDDRIKLLLNHALVPKTGDLGVVVESCPLNQRAVTKTLTPLAKQKGFTVAATASVPCGKATDGGKAVAALKAKKVKQVLFVSGANEAILVRAFTKAAKTATFAPVYGLTSASAPSTLVDQRDRVVGVGWATTLDTTSATSSVEINDCLRDVRHAGAAQPTTTARFATFSACDLLNLADRVLRLTKGSTDATAVRNAVKATGRLFKAASTFGSATDFRTRQTGPAQGSTFAWASQCTCIQYVGDPFAV